MNRELKMQALLVAEGLTKDYRVGKSRTPLRLTSDPSRPALRDASLSIARGAVLGLVGESGSGKSTLARCLSLLERPDSGRVILDGLELTALTPRRLRRERRRIQVVFQDPYASLNPRLTIGAALGEVLHVHALVPRAEIGQRVRSLLALVGLPDNAADRYPAEFSGGQRQRACIARALAAEPEILIADEPLSSLDVSIQAQILNLLLDLREQLGLAMVFVSHDLHVVRRIAPTIAVMFAGQVVEVLSPEVPLDSARHPYTQSLLAALPRLRTELPTTGGAEVGAPIPADGCPFRERCAYAFEPCAENDPALLPIEGNHLVACHYVLARVTSAESEQAIVEAE